MSGYEVVTASDETTLFSTVAWATANCPSGKIAVGGGAAILFATNPSLTSNGPSVFNSDGHAVAWTATAREQGLGTTATWTLRVHVICVDAP